MDVDGDGEIDFNEFATLLLDPCGENLMRAVARKILDCHELFALFDFDGGGTIDMDELRHVMTCLGHHPSDTLIDAVINFSDEENLGEDTSVGQLDFAEFVSLFACGADGGVSPLAYYCLNRQVVEFKESFSMFDLDTEGRIDLPSFEKGVACIMGDKMPKGLPAAIMNHLQELNGGLNMSFIEFSTMLCYPHTPLEALFKQHLQHARQAFAVFQRDETWQVRCTTLEAVLGPEASRCHRGEIDRLCHRSKFSDRMIFPFGSFCRLWRAQSTHGSLSSLLRTRVDELQGVFQALSLGLNAEQLSKNRARSAATGEGAGSARGVITGDSLVAAVEQFGGGLEIGLVAAENFLRGFIKEVGTGTIGPAECAAALTHCETPTQPHQAKSRASLILAERTLPAAHVSADPGFLAEISKALRFDPEVRPKASIDVLQEAIQRTLQVSFLTQLPKSQLRACCRYFRRQELAAGEVLFTEGEKGKTLYIVTSGCIGVCSYPREPTPAQIKDQAKLLAKSQAPVAPEALWASLDPEGKGALTGEEMRAAVAGNDQLAHWLAIREADPMRFTFQA